MKVADFMTKEVITLTLDHTVEDAARLMLDKDISVIPIVDSKTRLVGIFTEGDFIGKNANIPHALASIKKVLGQISYSESIETLFQRSKGLALKKVMTESPKTIAPDCTLTDAVELMGRQHLKRIPVVENNELIGIITRRDIIKAFTMIEGPELRV